MTIQRRKFFSFSQGITDGIASGIASGTFSVMAVILLAVFISFTSQGARAQQTPYYDLSTANKITGIPFKGIKDHPEFLKQLEAVMSCAAGVRRFGAASLDLAYVAAGRYDGFWETGLQPWDIAAGIVLVREAGGFVTEISGGTEMLVSGSILAANDSLHGSLGQLLRETAAS